eukprot:8597062-Pyramimonas_sp.AAC.1
MLCSENGGPVAHDGLVHRRRIGDDVGLAASDDLDARQDEPLGERFPELAAEALTLGALAPLLTERDVVGGECGSRACRGEGLALVAEAR